MKALYQDRKVKVTKMITTKKEYITHPILLQVKIEWKEGGRTVSNWVDANTVEFLD